MPLEMKISLDDQATAMLAELNRKLDAMNTRTDTGGMVGAALAVCGLAVTSTRTLSRRSFLGLNVKRWTS